MNYSAEIQLKKHFEDLDIKRVCHIGAYMGEESRFYDRFNLDQVVMIECNPYLFSILENNISNKPKYLAYNYVMSSLDDEILFNLIYSDDRTNLGCSSIHKLKDHAKLYPQIKEIETIILQTRTVKKLYKEQKLASPDFINIDVQGAEYDVLSNCGAVLDDVKLILCETAKIELYEGGCLETDITNYLRGQGFELIDYFSQHEVWGDSLYKRINNFGE